MSNKKPLVSIVIPTKNSAEFLASCLRNIKLQTYKNIEVIIVDGGSTDNVKDLAKKYKCKFYNYLPNVEKGIFDAPYKRNYGMSKAKGEFAYWLDADMELTDNLIQEAVNLCEKGADAVILPEDSFGLGMWARAKRLERRCYWNDSSVESPRFYKKSVWDAIGGFDLSLGAGGDDIDLSQKLLENKFVIKRTRSLVMHNEGNLKLINLMKKRYMYGKEMLNYLKKRPKSWVSSYNPFKGAYFRNWRLFLRNPLDTMLFLVMRSAEYGAGFMGFLHSFFNKKINSSRNVILDKRDYSDYSSQYYGMKIPSVLERYLRKSIYKSLLDLGCGDGSLLFVLKKNGFFKDKKIYAIDNSKKSINIVKRIDKSINAFVDNAENIKSIKKNTIDFLISTMVIEHVDDKKMVEQINKITNKNGIIYITTVYKKPYGWYFYRRGDKWVMDKTHLREYMQDKDLLKLFDNKSYKLLENNKSLIWFPMVDFIIRKLMVKNRSIFVENKIFNILRSIKVPIIGYYNWELIFKKL
jgi:glycosyltransferase involved in cell wall biosynthesis